MNLTALLQIPAAIVGSFGFSLLFNIRGKNLIFATLGGGLSWTLFLVLGYWQNNEPLRYFIVALTVSLYAEGMARLLRSPATIFIAPSMIPMVPGASLYYTMSHALSKNTEDFIQRGTATLALAAALAVGIILSAVLMHIVEKAKVILKKRQAHRLSKKEAHK